jgi:hypothetical protein
MVYGLPENFDASFLVGQTLEMVSFNANQLYLHFSGHITITVEGTFSYQNVSFQSAQPIHVPVQESNLMQLLEHTVSQASGDRNGTLSLAFDNGQIFQCFDSSKGYESYQIKIGEKVIVV